MAEVQMLLIDEVLAEVTAANGGELVIINAAVEGLGPIKMGMPLLEAQKLFGALMIGIREAHNQRSALFGGDQNLANMQGLAPYRPTDFELGQASSPEEILVLLRLKQDRVPLVDVILDFPAAEQLASELLDHARRGPTALPLHQ